MKRVSYWMAAVFVLPTGLGAVQPMVMRDAATHEQLVQQSRIAQQQDPMKFLPAAEGADPARNQPKDLISQSDLICYGGLATLVPKHAILQIPQNLASRTRLLPGCRIVNWAEFLTANRGWITTVEVSQVQARGQQALDGGTLELLKNHPNLVVATFLGGPISVLPLKAPASEAQPAIAAQAANSKS